MMRFLMQFPGFERLRLERLQPEAGVRETYRIVGETKVSVGDYTSRRVFADGVGYSFYPIDLHDERGIRPWPLKQGTVATIPLGALIPKGSRDVMVAGRCISSDRLANSASALAAKGSVTLAEILKALRQHGAITPA